MKALDKVFLIKELRDPIVDFLGQRSKRIKEIPASITDESKVLIRHSGQVEEYKLTALFSCRFVQDPDTPEGEREEMYVALKHNIIEGVYGEVRHGLIMMYQDIALIEDTKIRKQLEKRMRKLLWSIAPDEKQKQAAE